MKANELMLGDWVHYSTNLGKDGIYEKDIQISNIYGFDVNCDVRDYTITSGLHMSNLSPIPLNPEILEKNGFEMFKYDGWVHYYRIFGNNAIPFVLHSMIGGEMLSQEINMFSTSTNTNCGIDVNYVHELQHALRLCGLNDLADNFKV